MELKGNESVVAKTRRRLSLGSTAVTVSQIGQRYPRVTRSSCALFHRNDFGWNLHAFSMKLYEKSLYELYDFDYLLVFS